MGGLKSKASVSPAKTSQRAGRRTTPLKFHLLWHPLQVPPPGSMNAPHCKPGTPSSARSPAYCRCREQSGHTGAAETRPRQQGVPVSLRMGVGRRKMGQMGQGHGGPWSRWGPEGSHLSADPALRSCSEFTQPSNCCSFIYFFGLFFCISPSSFPCLSLAPSPAFLFPVCPASQLDITS